MGEKVDCQYSENCTGHGDKCLTCVNNSKRDYYEPAIRTEEAPKWFPWGNTIVYWTDGIPPHYNY
ncbi:hypothetical protein LCGC14_2577810 [marine sediment metagenome]|uniref:Uncharacterized protein n=1 Tax=marine sediment metagenome TaxID=412755 RepID=A0A0F9CRI5_9ZZZZ